MVVKLNHCGPCCDPCECGSSSSSDDSSASSDSSSSESSSESSSSEESASSVDSSASSPESSSEGSGGSESSGGPETTIPPEGPDGSNSSSGESSNGETTIPPEGPECYCELSAAAVSACEGFEVTISVEAMLYCPEGCEATGEVVLNGNTYPFSGNSVSMLLDTECDTGWAFFVTVTWFVDCAPFVVQCQKCFTIEEGEFECP